VGVELESGIWKESRIRHVTEIEQRTYKFSAPSEIIIVPTVRFITGPVLYLYINSFWDMAEREQDGGGSSSWS
jgi:hypothetical protein